MTLGQMRNLPVQISQTAEELKEAAGDPLRITAYQYVSEHGDSDLADLLAKRKDFESAMQDANATAA